MACIIRRASTESTATSDAATAHHDCTKCREFQALRERFLLVHARLNA